MPNLRSLAQLRSLLPYAAKILPVLTGVAIGEIPVQRPDLSALNRHFGEMQSENRGLRSRMEGQGEQLGHIQDQLDRLTLAIETTRGQQQELAATFHGLAGLLKRLLFAVLFLLIVITALCVLMLFRILHG